MPSDPRSWLLYVLPQAPDPRRLAEIARLALEGGADVLQLRLKDVDDGEWLEAGRLLRSLTAAFGRPLIVNDRPDIARLLGADGVHLGQGDASVAEARRVLPKGSIVGVSVGGPDEARRAAADGADYVAVGPIRATPVKGDLAPVGTAMVGRVRRAIDLPLMAIGGIDADIVAATIEAGADGVAVIGAVCRAVDPREAARRLRAEGAAAVAAGRRVHVG